LKLPEEIVHNYNLNLRAKNIANITVLYFGKTTSGLPARAVAAAGLPGGFYRVACTGSHWHVKILAPAFQALYSCL